MALVLDPNIGTSFMFSKLAVNCQSHRPSVHVDHRVLVLFPFLKFQDILPKARVSPERVRDEPVTHDLVPL